MLQRVPLTVLLGCPICGKQPEVTTDGSSIYIDCCVSMSRQKCDYMTIDERGTYDNKTYSYAAEIEEKVFNLVADEWNTRAS